MVADFTFMAEDIFHALEELGEHFTKAAEGEGEEDALFIGQCEIKPSVDFENA